jgi:hypothetical protein
MGTDQPVTTKSFYGKITLKCKSKLKGKANPILRQIRGKSNIIREDKSK